MLLKWVSGRLKSWLWSALLSDQRANRQPTAPTTEEELRAPRFHRSESVVFHSVFWMYLCRFVVAPAQMLSERLHRALFCNPGPIRGWIFCFFSFWRVLHVFVLNWHFTNLVDSTIASLTRLFSWLKDAPPGINPSSCQQKKKYGKKNKSYLLNSPAISKMYLWEGERRGNKLKTVPWLCNYTQHWPTCYIGSMLISQSLAFVGGYTISGHFVLATCPSIGVHPS